MKKNVLITGGSRGIGAHAVRRFKELNCNVVFFYRNSEEKASVLAEETGAYAIQCDVSKASEVERAVKDATVLLEGRIDVLVANAGISKVGLFSDMTDYEWQEVIDVNLNGTYYSVKNVLPGMLRNKKGKIITISSMWGEVGASCEVAYSSAKAGIIGLTKSLSKELAASNINVNCVTPGMIDTDMNASFSDEEKKEIVGQIPVGRIGTTYDVVNVIEFLASDKSDYITGQVIGVNGGMVI